MKKKNRAIVLFFLALAAINAKDIYIPQDYPDIQTAIDNAFPFDRIIIDGGKHRGPLLIGIPLTIEGKEGTRPVIYKETNNNTISPLIMTGANIRVVLKNLTLSATAPETPLSSEAIGILAKDTNLSLENIDITGFYLYSLIQTGGSLSTTDTKLLTNPEWEIPIKGGFYLYGLSTINIDYMRSDLHEISTIIHIADKIPFKERLSLNTKPFITEPITGATVKLQESQNTPVSIVRIYGSRLLVPDKRDASAILITGKANIIMLDNYIYSIGDNRTKTSISPSAAIRIQNQAKLRIVKNRITDTPRALRIENTKSSVEISVEESSIINNNAGIEIINSPFVKLDLGGGELGSKGNNTLGNTYSDIKITGKLNNLPITAFNNTFKRKPVIIIDDSKEEKIENIIKTEEKPST
ncbi:DUF1565 domain-containing protein [Spirochaetia bacterium 38H-sp]|uniref:DUF1565 domain-containing protein n=1 Tax=Rarispira pelagica TaxID=3141764 RepID=A0ABU9U903_9SPIR